jgi:hypothetical protein
MPGPERLLEVAERAVRRGEALDGPDVRAIRLDGEQQAGPDGGTVHHDRAGATDAVLAADVGPGQAEVMPEVVGQEEPRLDA